MRTSYHSISSARRLRSWLMVALGLSAYVGLLYGLTMLPLQFEVPLPHWGVAVVPPIVYGLLVLLCVRWPTPVRWLVGTALLSGLHVLLGLARGPVSAFLDPSLAGRPLPWVLPPPLPELVAVILLLVPLRDLLRPRPRSARERMSAGGRAVSGARGRAVVPRTMPSTPAESRYTPSEAPTAPRVEASPESFAPAAPVAPIAPAPPVDPTPDDELRRRRAAARAERRREMEIPRPPSRSDVVLRIALDRIMGQLPPGTFLAPEDEVAASLRDPGYLLIPGELVVTQLAEGVARVAWSDIVDQFPPQLIGLGSAEIGEHLGDGLRLPLDEVVGQLPHELFAADSPEVELSGLERIPVPFHPLEESGSIPSVTEPAIPEVRPSPTIERPRVGSPVAERGPRVLEPPVAPRLEAAPVRAPEPPPVEEPVVSRPEPMRVPGAEPVPAPELDEPTVRISFGRVAAELPAEAFREPLEQVATRMHHPGALLVPLSRVLPQLGEGLIRIGWEVVAAQFPREQLAVSDADMAARLPNGIQLPLDEVVRQLSPDLFMTGGPAPDVSGLESFPAPFQPLLSDPAPVVAAAGVEAPAPVVASPPEPEAAAEAAVEPSPGVSPPAVLEVAPTPDPIAGPVPSIAPEPSIVVEPVAPVVEARSVSDDIAAAPPVFEPATPVATQWSPAPEPALPTVSESPRVTEPLTSVVAEKGERVETGSGPGTPGIELEPTEPIASLQAFDARAKSEPHWKQPVPEPAAASRPAASAGPAPVREWSHVASPVEPTPVASGMDPAAAAEARRILTLLAPIASFEVSVQPMEGVTVFAMTAPALTPETAVAATGLALPLLTDRRAPWPLDQITLRGPDTALVLTPLDPASPRGPVLATAAPRGGALALLEILGQRAAAERVRRGDTPTAAHTLPDRGRSLVPVPVAAAAARHASSLNAFGPVTPSMLRDTEGEGIFYFFLPTGADVPAVGVFAQDLQAVIRKAAGSGAVFRTAVLRSRNTLVVIQPEEVGHGRSIVVVAGGEVTRPGLAYRQVERVTAMLAQA
jgi:hypothetical protein